MDREFRTLLKDAEGRPQLVIAVNADIRGFSHFSSRDSFEVALFIKKVYIKLIDEYFAEASFVKPTGDGLLVVFHYADSDYKAMIARTIRACLDVVKDFPSFFVGDNVVRFEVPKKIGIGLSTGTACRLVSGDKTLDYSGKILNLASRLMDFARPSGVVLDSSVGIDLLPPELSGLFVKDKVCVRGIEEKTPLEIYHTKDVVILPSDREPKTAKWRSVRKRVLVKEVRHASPSVFRFALPTPAIDPSAMTVTAYFQVPALKSVSTKGIWFTDIPSSKTKYMSVGGEPVVDIELEEVVVDLRDQKLKDNQIVTFDIRYTEA